MHGGKFARRIDLAQERQQLRLVLDLVDLVDRQHHGHAGRFQRVVGERIAIVPAARLDHQHRGIDTLHCTAGRTIHHAMHGRRRGRAVVAMDSGRVDQHQLATLETGDA